MESGREDKCPARSIRTPALDALVWADLCAVVQQPALVTHALERAHGGHWLPQELHARRTNLRKAQATLNRQLERLTEAYLAEIVGLDEYKRRRQDLEDRHATLVLQEQQLEGQVTHRHELVGMIQSMEAFCARVAQGLAVATFAQRRQLVELLIDRVVVHANEIEIRYVLPMSSKSEHIQFCHLRSDYADRIAKPYQGHR
jgi:site-specific DNA recombinase